MSKDGFDPVPPWSRQEPLQAGLGATLGLAMGGAHSDGNQPVANTGWTFDEIEFARVAIRNDFWSPQQQKVAVKALAACIYRSEIKTARIRNFEKAASRPACVDLKQATVNVFLDAAELEARRKALEQARGYVYPASQTPWQEMQRRDVGQLQDGAVLEPATQYQRLAQTAGIPRHSH